MFNPEKLLGGLLGSSTRGSRKGLGGLVSSGVALGALGVAMEAFEHFTDRPQAGKSPAAGGPPPFSGSVPPPPPPHPPAVQQTSAPPPPPGAASEPTGNSEAVLLIRAMIAAANADGVIDPEERNRILGRLQIVDLSPEEHAFITQELLSPVPLEAVVDDVKTPELARQVYAVSLMAITVDTDEERNYLKTLARRLGLETATVEQIHNGLETE